MNDEQYHNPDDCENCQNEPVIYPHDYVPIKRDGHEGEFQRPMELIGERPSDTLSPNAVKSIPQIPPLADEDSIKELLNIPSQPLLECDINKLWAEIVRFNDKHFKRWRDQDLRLISNALAGEAGELCDKTKHFYYQGTNKKEIDRVNPETILEEAFDVFVYTVLMVGAIRGEGAKFMNEKYDRELFVKVGLEKVKVLYERMGDKYD